MFQIPDSSSRILIFDCSLWLFLLSKLNANIYIRCILACFLKLKMEDIEGMVLLILGVWLFDQYHFLKSGSSEWFLHDVTCCASDDPSDDFLWPIGGLQCSFTWSGFILWAQWISAHLSIHCHEIWKTVAIFQSLQKWWTGQQTLPS